MVLGSRDIWGWKMRRFSVARRRPSLRKLDLVALGPTPLIQGHSPRGPLTDQARVSKYSQKVNVSICSNQFTTTFKQAHLEFLHYLEGINKLTFTLNTHPPSIPISLQAQSTMVSSSNGPYRNVVQSIYFSTNAYEHNFTQAQTPAQRKANAKFAKTEEEKRGKPQEAKKKKEVQKSPYGPAVLGTLQSLYAT